MSSSLARRLTGTRSLGLAIGDQAVSSLTNVIAVLVVARQLDAASFGSFSLTYVVLTLFLGVGRAFFGLPLSLSARAGGASSRRLFEQALAALLAAALPISLVVFGVGSTLSGSWHGSQSAAIIAVAVATPLVLLQDVARYYALAIGRAGTALLADAVWFVGVVGLFITPLHSLALFSWWIGAILASLVIFTVSFHPKPEWEAAVQALRPERGLRTNVSGTVILSNITSLSVNGLASSRYGLELVGGLRGASTLFGPVNTLITFLDFAVLPRLVRRPEASARRLLLATFAATVASTVLWVVVLLNIPDAWGVWLLGETWRTASSIFHITAVEYVLLVCAAILSLILKTRNAGRSLLVSKVISSAAIIVGVAVALFVSSTVHGVPLAIALGAGISCLSLAVSVLLTSPRRKRDA